MKSINPKIVFAITAALFQAGFSAQTSAATLATADGATYGNITSQRADPDGVYIEYTIPGGGLGMAKVKYSRLSDDQRKQFGYDAAKASEFESQRAKGVEAWRADALKVEQESRAARVAEQAQAAQQEALDTEHLRALAQLKAIDLELARVNASGSEPVYGGWSGGFAEPVITENGIGNHSRNDNHSNLREREIREPHATTFSEAISSGSTPAGGRTPFHISR